MVLELNQVQNKDEFAPAVVVEHAVYSNPTNGFWEILKGPSQEECRDRQWNWHTSTPGSSWFCVTDTEIGEVIGAGQWILHETNPFGKPGPKIEASWWKEGELKAISEQVLNRFFSERPKYMSRPHLLMSYIFVSKEHRRRGAGSMLMDWGCELADEKNLECFVESTDAGRPLYESKGFVVFDYYDINPQMENASDAWQKLKEELFPEPMRCWLMWRPKGGKYVKGQMNYSWKE